MRKFCDTKSHAALARMTELYATVRHREWETGHSEQARWVLSSYTFQGVKQMSFYFRQGN